MLSGLGVTGREQRQRLCRRDREIGRGGGLVSTRVETLSRDDPPANRARPTRNWRQMFDNKLKTPFIALVGAVALMASAPAFAQTAAAPPPPPPPPRGRAPPRAERRGPPRRARRRRSCGDPGRAHANQGRRQA